MDHKTSGQRGGAGRDLRVDFFRGFALLSIYVAHIPYNEWSFLLLRHYAPIDSADIFVFCSGFAAAVAFGTAFTRAGFLAGCARVFQRCWQLYWAQISVFLVTVAACYLATEHLGTKDYVAELNLLPFMEDPGRGLVGLLTLTYVPNYFDILPMYFVMLAMIPAIVLVRHLGVTALMAAALLLWAMPKLMPFNLPAEWWSDRGWYFNPFVWQLLFVTAFALASGWIKAPPVNRWMIGVALGYVVLMIPLSLLYDEFSWIWALRDATWSWGWQKSQLGFFRFLHILALAYLAFACLSARDRLFDQAWAKALIAVGQQGLPVFMASIVLAQLAGMALDVIGRDNGASALVNLGGFLILYGVALLCRYYKSTPWRKSRQPTLPRHATTSVAAENVDDLYSGPASKQLGGAD